MPPLKALLFILVTKIAILGSGAVGLFYGGQLVLAGHDVRFLLRRDHARIVENGLVIHSTGSPEVTAVRAPLTVIPASRFRACSTPEQCVEDGPLEWVVLAVKTTSLGDIQPSLARVLGKDARTRLVVMCNGIGVEERLAEHVASERIYAALAHVCLNRRDDGSVDHLAHGKLLLGHQLDAPERVRELSLLITSAGISSYQVSSLREARYRKLVWHLPYNGLSVVLGARGCDTEAIMSDAGSRELVGELMREVISVANADLARIPGAALIEPTWSDEMFNRTTVMGPYLTSTLLDWRAGRPLEIETMFAEPVARARRLGVHAPRMEMLLSMVRDRARSASA